jgi:hypothetical protein
MFYMALVGLGALMVTTPVAAHHSFAAEFDGNQFVTVRGTVTKMEWVNPHSWIHLSAKEPDGRVTEWQFELGSPNALFRAGWRKDSLPTGIEIVVRGYRARDGSNRANGRDVVLPDGKELFGAGSSPKREEKP